MPKYGSLRQASDQTEPFGSHARLNYQSGLLINAGISFAAVKQQAGYNSIMGLIAARAVIKLIELAAVPFQPMSPRGLQGEASKYSLG